MAKRLILTLVVVALVLGALGFIKTRQIKSAMAAGAFTPPPESVTTTIAKKETWPSNLNAIGTAVAVHGVTVSADLPGTVDKIFFDSGKWVNQGDVLVQLDIRQEQAQLAANEAQRELSHIQYARMKKLVDEGVVSKQEYDQATAQQRQGDANVDQVRATIARKTIRAPFSGVLGIRQVNLGQYLAAGDPIVPLQSLDPIYVNFNAPQEAVDQVQVGRTVKISASQLPGTAFTGRVTALNSVVDSSTRNIMIQATVANPQRKLRPGMFVNVEASTGQDRQVVSLPATAINYAPYGDSVFIVTDMKDPKTGKSYKGARQQFVKVEGSRGDQVAVISGLNPGEEVVTGGVFKLRPNAAVQVNNKIQPPNDPSPRPEDN
jgi:membrane fusion protein (multidrug efflux system)